MALRGWHASCVRLCAVRLLDDCRSIRHDFESVDYIRCQKASYSITKPRDRTLSISKSVHSCQHWLFHRPLVPDSHLYTCSHRHPPSEIILLVHNTNQTRHTHHLSLLAPSNRFVLDQLPTISRKLLLGRQHKLSAREIHLRSHGCHVLCVSQLDLDLCRSQ